MTESVNLAKDKIPGTESLKKYVQPESEIPIQTPIFTDAHRKTAEIALKMANGLASDEEIAWAREQAAQKIT